MVHAKFAKLIAQRKRKDLLNLYIEHLLLTDKSFQAVIDGNRANPGRCSSVDQITNFQCNIFGNMLNDGVKREDHKLRIAGLDGFAVPF